MPAKTTERMPETERFGEESPDLAFYGSKKKKILTAPDA